MQDLQGLPAGIYVRISDDREGRELGVQRQEADCRRLADRLGVDVVDVYCDNDLSASALAKKDRPEYDRLMADLASGGIKVVLSYTTSRLTRDNTEAEQIIALTRTVGYSPWFVASPWCDLTTAAGRRMYRTLAVSDTGEAEDIQERITRKKLEDAVQGRINGGGKRCYGYGPIIGTNPMTGQVIRNFYATVPDEVAALLEGKERTLAGDSTALIVRDFRRRGIKTAYGKDWTVGGYRRTLLNPTYIIFDPDDPEQRGTRVHKASRHQGKHPGIFTQTEHDMLQDIFAQNAVPYRGKTDGRSYLLTGITFCAECGARMYGHNKQYRRKTVRRYGCKKWNSRGEQIGCGRVFRVADVLEDFVTEAVLYRFDSPDVAAALVPHQDRERAKQLNHELVRLQKRRKELAAQYALGVHDDEDYTVMLSAVKDRIATAEGELLRLRSAEARLALMPDLTNLRQRFETASLEWRLSVIRLLVERIVIHPTDKRVYYNGRQFDPSKLEIQWRN